MANFITVNDYEMLNADYIIGFRLNPADGGKDPKINGNVSLTVSLFNNTCVTIYDYRNIYRFFEELFYHFNPGEQPDTYYEIYEKFLKMTNYEEEQNEN